MLIEKVQLEIGKQIIEEMGPTFLKHIQNKIHI